MILINKILIISIKIIFNSFILIKIDPSFIVNVKKFEFFEIFENPLDTQGRTVRCGLVSRTCTFQNA